MLTVSFLTDSELNLDAAEQIRRQAMTGRAIVGVEVRVVDAAGQEFPNNGQVVEEIVVRGDSVMEEYWRRPEETKASFRNGWFLTGDMAVWDEGGAVLIVDRKTEMVISGGENISSLGIEKALAAHPCVLECAVIPVPDEDWGEVREPLWSSSSILP